VVPVLQHDVCRLAVTVAGRRAAFARWPLLGLFVTRVVAQLLIALGAGRFLPPWEEWFSGAVAYPLLLASQIAIILVFATIALEVTTGRGVFAVPRRRAAVALLAIGSVYLAVMAIRYAIRMTLYPHERWSGGSIPIFFHWVLAGFVLVLGFYHRRFAPRLPTSLHPIRARAVQSVVWLLTILGVAGFVIYQLAPTLLARVLASRPAEYAVRIDRHVAMTTSDGVTLRADIYRPVRAGATPTILVRIPFSKTIENSLFATVVGRFWAERGYTAVIQGTRGRYESGGEYYPLMHERRDGLETLAWLNGQAWFDGRLGMWGGSAFGHTQWAVADRLPAGPSGRSALMVQISSTDFHGMFYPGGAFSLASALFWAIRSRGAEDGWPDAEALGRGAAGLPLLDADDRAGADVPFFNDWVGHPARDAYWQRIDGEDRAASLQGPVLLTAGWFDPFLPGQLADFVRIQRGARHDVAGATRLIVGPWAHAETVTLPGAGATRNYRLESLAPSVPWFDRNLRSMGPGAQPDSPVRLFVMGTNVWRDEPEWPLVRAIPMSWYLRSGGRANSASGDGGLSTTAPTEHEPPDTFASDPKDPVPTRGGAMLGSGSGVARQDDVELRRDVLVYTTAPLVDDVEVTGPLTATLYVATSAPHTDFTAKLVDVHRDGTPFNVSDGILRRQHTASTDPARADPVAIEISLWPTSMVFRQGHRIRLEVASSNFPRYDRNPNTGAPIATATVTAVARQAVHHGPQAPSRIVLPVVPSTR
jgi:putative CocE/NonD family hydrolase